MADDAVATADVGLALFEALARNATDLVAINDAQGHIRYISPSVRRILGYKPQDLVGRSSFDFLHPQDLAAVAHSFGEISVGRQAPRPVRFRFRHADGSYRLLEATSTNLLDDPAIRGMVVNARDVTESAHAQEQLRLLESVVVHATDAVMITEAAPIEPPGPRVLYVNAAFTRLTGYAAEQVIGQTPRLLQGPATDRAALRRIRAALRAGEPVREELVNYTAEGRPFWIDLSIAPVRDAAGALTHFVAIQRDVTQQRHSMLLEQDRRRVLELLLDEAPLEQVLEAIVYAVERQQPGVLGAVMLVRDGRLWTGAAPNLPRAYIRAVEGGPMSPDLGSCGRAAALGEPVTTADLRWDPRWERYREVGVANGLFACRSTPIRSGAGEVVGTFAAYYTAPLAEDDPGAELPALAAQLAALAIERHRLSERLRYQAEHDALTGLPNRYQLHDQLSAALHDGRAGHGGALLFIDLDGFKQINDTLGHPVGDQLLIEVARRFLACLGPRDVLARTGGDEFLLLLPDAADPAAAGQAAQRLLDSLDSPCLLGEREIYATASIGVCLYPQDGDDVTTLLKHADAALYRAKEYGRNTYARFTPDLNARALARLDLEHHLRRAIERGELTLHYQPQFDLRTGELVGVEALSRWRHPTRGWVPPSEFIPIAEASALIISLGQWALETACRQNAAWLAAGRRPVRMAVNVSARQFIRDDFAEVVTRALETSGLPPERLELEITESVMMHDVGVVAQQLRRLRAIGVRIALDDFGTGYSSLAYLQRLALDRLKVDRRFVGAIGGPEGTAHAAALVESIITLAHSLGLTVLAEGVERLDQVVALRRAGCDEGQGFLWSRAVAAEQIEALLK